MKRNSKTNGIETRSHTIKLKYPDGTVMRLASDLTGFLANRIPKANKFRLGEWLVTLDEVDLGLLERRARKWWDQTEEQRFETANEVLAICLIAYVAETQIPEPQLTIDQLFEQIAKISMLANLEYCSRSGLVKFHGWAGISTAKPIEYKLTGRA